jgi:hypothetical protein
VLYEVLWITTGTKVWYGTWVPLLVLVLVLVLLQPMAQVGPLRMCLVPDVVSPRAVFLFLAVLGVLHHGHSVVFVRIFETIHCFRPLYVPRDHVPCFHFRILTSVCCSNNKLLYIGVRSFLVTTS